MAKKKKDNLRRGKRGPVPRFDYHVVFSGTINRVHKFVNNVKDVLTLGWEAEFRIDSHLLNKYVLKDGRAVFKRKDGAEMSVSRSLKHTTEQMVLMYLTNDEEKLDYVDSYLALNPGLRRKVSPILKVASKGAMRIRPFKTEEEANAYLINIPVPGVELPAEIVSAKDAGAQMYQQYEE
jgi:hypothetical protein